MDLRIAQLHSQAQSLAALFDREGRTTKRYIDGAIARDREALGLCQSYYHRDQRYVLLIHLSTNLSTRYEQFGATGDIEEAIIASRKALVLCPRGHPERSTSLASLELCLTTRFNLFGALADLEEVIVLGREALTLRPQGHPLRSNSLGNLAISLSDRYRKLGALADLEEAIVFNREALALSLQGHPNHPIYLRSLACHLAIRYDKLGALADLDEAIALDREALALHPQGDPEYTMALNSLATRLFARHRKFGVTADLDMAIFLHREALALCPQGHPDRSFSLVSLAGDLTARYDRFGEITDINEAILLYKEAFVLYPNGHPDRWSCLDGITDSLIARCDGIKVKSDLDAPSSDLEEAFYFYATVADLSYAVSSAYHIDVSRTWADNAEKYKHSSTRLAYETSLRLLVEYLALLPPLPERLVVLKKYASPLAVDAFSACLRNGAPKRGVELLEQGRSVFWDQLTRLRSSVDDVTASGPAGEILAKKFTHLATLIREALHSSEKYEQRHAFHLNSEMQKTVTAIRRLPASGLSRFLFPPLFSDLQRAASKGPVIIVNSSRYGCDALIIIDSHDPVHIPLSVTRGYLQLLSLKFRGLSTRENSRDVTNALCGILRELWEDIVSPIACFLQTIHPLQSRIWWCPTAELSDLPLHAAGPYRTGQQNLPDLYISSYTPTLSALIRARRPHISQSTNDMKRFISVGLVNTVGQNNMPSSLSELSLVGRDVRGVAEFTKFKEISVPGLAEMLQKNEWVHFACHGLANCKEPSKSAFALSDGHFSIERIIQCNIENPEFAYLSACQTMVRNKESQDGKSQGEKNSEPEEVIHLASAMQSIGFRSVIGTMWATEDEVSKMIASTLFKHMLDESGHLDYTRAALALNETMRTISKSDIPLDQRVPYIHLGA